MWTAPLPGSESYHGDRPGLGHIHGCHLRYGGSPEAQSVPRWGPSWRWDGSSDRHDQFCEFPVGGRETPRPRAYSTAKPHRWQGRTRSSPRTEPPCPQRPVPWSLLWSEARCSCRDGWWKMVRFRARGGLGSRHHGGKHCHDHGSSLGQDHRIHLTTPATIRGSETLRVGPLGGEPDSSRSARVTFSPCSCRARVRPVREPLSAKRPASGRKDARSWIQAENPWRPPWAQWNPWWTMPSSHPVDWSRMACIRPSAVTLPGVGGGIHRARLPFRLVRDKSCTGNS
jgi:hypothetical protein